MNQLNNIRNTINRIFLRFLVDQSLCSCSDITEEAGLFNEHIGLGRAVLDKDGDFQRLLLPGKQGRTIPA